MSTAPPLWLEPNSEPDLTLALGRTRATEFNSDPDFSPLAKALSGRLESITIDRIARWLVALGKSVRINVEAKKRGAERATMSVRAG